MQPTVTEIRNLKKSNIIIEFNVYYLNEVVNKLKRIYLFSFLQISVLTGLNMIKKPGKFLRLVTNYQRVSGLNRVNFPILSEYRKRPTRLFPYYAFFTQRLSFFWEKLDSNALREMSPSTEFFLVRIRENTDQKKLLIWTLFTQQCLSAVL